MKILLGFLLAFFNLCEAKVLIITYVYNRPDFIDYHCRTFEKFLLDDYEYMVFNDAPPGEKYDEIKAVCRKWNVPCIDNPEWIHQHTQEEPFWHEASGTGTRRHSDGINFSMRAIGYKYDGIVALFDSDLFLIKPLSIEKLMQGKDIVSVMRQAWNDNPALEHLWPGLTFLAMNRLPNKETLDFKCGNINGNIVDTGGYTYYYLRDNNLRVESLGLHSDNPTIWENSKLPPKDKILSFRKQGFSPTQINWLMKYPDPDVEFFYQGHFIHVKGARLDPEEKVRSIVELLETSLAE